MTNVQNNLGLKSDYCDCHLGGLDKPGLKIKFSYHYYCIWLCRQLEPDNRNCSNKDKKIKFSTLVYLSHQGANFFWIKIIELTIWMLMIRCLVLRPVHSHQSKFGDKILTRSLFGKLSIWKKCWHRGLYFSCFDIRLEE